MKKSIIIAVMLVSFFSLKAQEYFEGTITMKLKYEGAMASMLSKMSSGDMIIKLKDEKSSMRLAGGIGSMLGNVVSNGSEFFMVMDKSKTVYVEDKKTDDNSEESTDNEDVVADYIDLKVTEQIAGYKCHKYEIKYKEEQEQEISKYYVWICKDFKAKFYSEDEGKNNIFNNQLGGFPFKQEITMNSEMGTITTVTVVTEAKKEKINDSVFEIPKDYKVKSMDEFNPLGF